MTGLVPADWKLPGRLKVEPEDFLVEEIPAYEPCGYGEHLFLWIEKRDVSADFLLGHLARTLQVRRDEIGMAGMKDRRGVTRQWLSLPSAAESRLEALNCGDVRLLRSSWHTNKLKTGHLRGNRFEILARLSENQARLDAPADAVGPAGIEHRARRIADLVAAKGVPNRFGEQRFGIDGETRTLGLSLLRGEAFPSEIPFKRRKFLTRLALSAVQSSLFNQLLDRRLQQGTLHQVHPGDVMQVVSSGGLFLAEDVPAEQERFDRRETVITGPLFGPKMKTPEGPMHALERGLLDENRLADDSFRRFKKLTPGGRRPLLLWPEEFTLDLEPEGLRFRFILPSGAYATVVLDEFLKDE